jgi:hypothetical protein
MASLRAGETPAMTTTISNSHTATVTLTAQYTTITDTGTVSVASGIAVDGTASSSIGWTVVNSGTVTGGPNGLSGYGIWLAGIERRHRRIRGRTPQIRRIRADESAIGSTLAAGGVNLDGQGTIINGAVRLAAATLDAAYLAGTGAVTIGSGSTLALSGPVGSGAHASMTGTGDVLDIGGGTKFAGVITGFGATGVIDVQGIGSRIRR